MLLQINEYMKYQSVNHSINQYIWCSDITNSTPSMVDCRLPYADRIGVARILFAGVHFFTTQQKLLKIDSCSGWGGVHLVSCGGALAHFSCKLGLKKIFYTALGGCRCTHCTPLAMPMADRQQLQYINKFKSSGIDKCQHFVSTMSYRVIKTAITLCCLQWLSDGNDSSVTMLPHHSSVQKPSTSWELLGFIFCLVAFVNLFKDE